MNLRLSYLIFASASSLSISGSVFAEGGASGNSGDIVTIDPALVSIGPSGVGTAGADGASFTGVGNLALLQGLMATSSGQNGDDASGNEGGGGSGGAGGGSMFAVFSQGGAGGSSVTGAADGGHGGAISGLRVDYRAPNLLNFTGTAGGSGGKGSVVSSSSSDTDAYGGGGDGGNGGGSLFAAFSKGGAAGYTTSNSATADGGAGGAIADISINLSQVTQTGAIAGYGGQAASYTLDIGLSPNTRLRAEAGGGGGAGGTGGGSIFAAFSQGGAAGYSTASANGGSGGVISEVNVSLSQIILLGASGGAGGQASTAEGLGGLGNRQPGYSESGGGGGAGGAGGGSIFAAFSQGGAAGSTGTASLTPSSAKGGTGGEISAITFSLRDAELNGASGGDGGSAAAGTVALSGAGVGSGSSSGGGGSGGLGGGSVIAAFSQGGAAGLAMTNVSGGAGGDVSDVDVSLSNLTLTGGTGGTGGQAGTWYRQGNFGNGDGDGFGAGAGGLGGAGGGSVFAVFSQGGAGGFGVDDALAEGGSGGDISAINLNISSLNLTGAAGGAGGQAGRSFDIYGFGAGGSGGVGGGSVFAAFSQGGGGGYVSSLALSANGGAGGDISAISLSLSEATMLGAVGGRGAAHISTGNSIGNHVDNGRFVEQNNPSARGGGGGAGGAGGGSVFASFSQGGAGGHINSPNSSSANGGAGGAISTVDLNLSNLQLYGGQGGAGGQASTGFSDATSNSATPLADSAGAGGGAGGVGGGSVFAAFSQGGAGGFANVLSFDRYSAANGGAGGDISATNLALSNVTLTGANGGVGGQASVVNGSKGFGFGPGGTGGAGGGSIFAGFSQGGAGGVSYSLSSGSADGGAGGYVSGNQLDLNDIRLVGAAGGIGGTGGMGGTLGVGTVGSDGVNGGSIFGGYSIGGSGGYANVYNLAGQPRAAGGNGGNTSGNRIRLSGISSLTGHIFGGYSQGGKAGYVGFGLDTQGNPSLLTRGNSGLGGEAINNVITLVGTELSIGGSLYGGFSVNGDVDFASLGYSSLNNSKSFMGNTLNLEGYRGSVEGVYNFEFYNWVLPADVVSRDVLIEIRGNDLVDLNNTKHSVKMVSDGNRLNENDEVVLISKAQGAQQPTRTEVQQGHFIIYDALLGVNDSDEFVLRIAGKDDATHSPTPEVPRDLEGPAGRLNPSSKALLQGRTATLAMVNQGADLLSEQLTECATDVFLIGNGGNSRYNSGSGVKVNDQRMAVGGRKCFELADASSLMLGVFAEHGTGNYHSSNNFAVVGKVHGHGDVRYTGGALVMHVDYASTGADITPEPVLGNKDGLYSDAVLRAGNVRADFASNQMIDADGKRAEYKSKSHYASAMFATGYAWNLGPQQQVDLYARYSWGRLASDKVKVGGDEVRFDSDHSSRLRIGTRYQYAVMPAIAPYAGIAYEHEFDGKVSGKVFEFEINQTGLKGSSGLLEVGVKTLPFGNDSSWQLDAGVQGYVGTRKGVSGTLNLKYEF